MSKPLRDLADVYYGKSPNEVVSDESVIPIIGTGGVYGRATRAMYQGPAVVVPRKGSLGIRSSPENLFGRLTPLTLSCPSQRSMPSGSITAWPRLISPN